MMFSLKKITALLCSGTMAALLSAGSFPAAALRSAADTQPVLFRVENVSALPGDTVPVTVSVEDNSGFAGVGIRLTYDSALQIQYDDDYIPDYTAGTLSENEMHFSAVHPEKHLISFVMLSEMNIKENGSLVSFRFTVPEDAAAGTVYQLTPEIDKLNDANYADVPFTCTGGTISVAAPETGTTVIPETTVTETETTTSATTTAKPQTSTAVIPETTVTETETTTSAATTTAKPQTSTAVITETTVTEAETTTSAATTTAKPQTSTTITTAATVTTTVITTTVSTDTTAAPASVRIRKQDQDGNPVRGATLSLAGLTVKGDPIVFPADSIELGDENNIISAGGDDLIWISSEETAVIHNMRDGAYTLHEIEAPEGYQKAADLTFLISGGKLTVISNKRVDENTVIVMVDKRSAVTTAATVTTTATAVTTTTSAAVTTATESAATSAAATTTATATDPPAVTTLVSNFQWGIDNWGFINSKKTLSSYDAANKIYSYDITDADRSLLFNRLSNIERNKISSILQGKNKGCCYGMSATAILQTYGFFHASDLVEGAENLESINSKNINQKVRSSIAYYQMLQYTKAVAQEMYYTSRQPDTLKMQKLTSALSEGRPVLVGYTFEREDGSTAGHAVVAYGMRKRVVSKTISTSERYQFDTEILVYNNQSNDNTDRYNIYTDSKTGLWLIPMTDDKNELDKAAIMSLEKHHKGNITLVTADTELINYHGLFGGNEKYQHDESAPYYAKFNMIPLQGDFCISVSDDPYDGTLASAEDDGDIRMTANCFGAEDEDEHYYTASMDSDCSYYVSVNEPEMIRAAMEYEHCLLNADCESADKLIVSPRSRIAMEHTAGAYSLSMIIDEGFHETDWHTVTISGKDGGTLLLTNDDANGGFLLTGENLKNVCVQAKNNTVSAEAVFSTECKKVLIYEIDPQTIGIKGDSDGDGTFETEIPQSGTESDGRGDLDGDGEATATDAQMVLSAYTEALATGKQELTGEKFTAADVDEDGEITAADAQYILIYFVQKNVVGDPKTWDELLKK